MHLYVCMYVYFKRMNTVVCMVDVCMYACMYDSTAIRCGLRRGSRQSSGSGGTQRGRQVHVAQDYDRRALAGT